MLKVIGGAIAGIFIGALSMEVMKQTQPDLVKQAEQRAERLGSELVNAFREGYRGQGIGDVAGKAKAVHRELVEAFLEGYRGEA